MNQKLKNDIEALADEHGCIDVLQALVAHCEHIAGIYDEAVTNGAAEYYGANKQNRDDWLQAAEEIKACSQETGVSRATRFSSKLRIVK